MFQILCLLLLTAVMYVLAIPQGYYPGYMYNPAAMGYPGMLPPAYGPPFGMGYGRNGLVFYSNGETNAQQPAARQ